MTTENQPTKKPQRINRKKSQLQFWDAAFLATLGGIAGQPMHGENIADAPAIAANFAAATASKSLSNRDTFEANLEAAQ